MYNIAINTLMGSRDLDFVTLRQEVFRGSLT